MGRVKHVLIRARKHMRSFSSDSARSSEAPVAPWGFEDGNPNFRAGRVYQECVHKRTGRWNGK